MAEPAGFRARGERATQRELALGHGLREVLESLPLAVAVLDRERRVVLWNRAAERLFGWPAGDAVGQPLPAPPPPVVEPSSHAGTPPPAPERDPQGGRSQPDVIRIRRADGSDLHVRVYASALRERGRIVGELRMFSDLTDHVQRERALDAMQAALRRSLAQRDAAVEIERTRIARELHDELGQALTALKMQLAWFGPRLPPGDPALGAAHAAMTELVDQTMAATRRLSSELRPALLDVAGLFGAIRMQAQAFERRTGIPCRLDLPARPLEPGAERTTAVFRVLQEILTNVGRHAAASQVEIRLARAGARLVLEVDDDGRGFDPQDAGPDSFGILGMRERAELLGGELTVARRHPRGTRVRLAIPLG